MSQHALAIESPDYEVLLRDGDVEFRHYPAYLVAQTTVENSSDRDEAASIGFRRLFKYITGENTTETEISMTAPVEQFAGNSQVGKKIDMTAPVEQVQNQEGWAVAFILPKIFNWDSAPVPSNPAVKIVERPARLVATLRYSGRWTDKNVARHGQELKSYLEVHSIAQVSPVQTAFYNAPFTPPFMRRNEVQIEVEQLPSASQ
jgi:hypothetical protein